MDASAALVAYCRVGTSKQGDSGLGLEAQQAAIAAYAGRANGRVVRTFIEVESGKRADRPQLRLALALAKRNRATLVVAKLDRLARNVAFLSALMDAGVDFVCCDNPHANRLTLHILAAVAEDEARRISERTKNALAALKARGKRLGGARANAHAFDASDRRKASEANRTASVEAYADLLPTAVELRTAGKSLQAIADQLNADGQRTRQGRPFAPITVLRMLNMNA